LGLITSCGSPGVDVLGRVGNHLLDLSFLVKFFQGEPGKRSINLEAIDEHGGGDNFVLGYFLQDFVEGFLVESDGVVGLILNLSL